MKKWAIVNKVDVDCIVNDRIMGINNALGIVINIGSMVSLKYNLYEKPHILSKKNNLIKTIKIEIMI